jgi:hypothetical protein
MWSQKNTFKQTRGQQYRCGVFYMVRADTVARQQPARQWTGWVTITWEPQTDTHAAIEELCFL